MERVKCVLRRLFVLPPVLTIALAIPSFAAVIYVLAAEIEGTAFTYFTYGISAYALVITVTGIFRLSRLVRQGIDNSPLVGKVRSSSLGEKVLTDVMYRAELSLYLGLCINLLYAVLKLVSGFYFHSIWFGTLAVYYGLLALMRFLLLRHVNKNRIGENLAAEFRRYRLCGIILLLMNQALAGVVILVVYKNSGFEYPGYLIYVMALYAFYQIITAVVNVIKFRKYGSPVMSASKTIKLTAALVSMLSLETAMLAQFGDADDAVFRRLMTGISGAAVCVLVLGMAVFMIVRSTKQLRRLCRDREREMEE